MNTSTLRDSTYQIRIDETTKRESFAVFQELGMTPAEGVRVFLRMVAVTKSIPFSLNVPNAKTKKVLQDSDAKVGVHKAKNAEDLFNQIGI
jgi:DNA-damage-inducible protein J